jgi:phosphotransferase system HPr (HPr) family protein
MSAERRRRAGPAAGETPVLAERWCVVDRDPGLHVRAAAAFARAAGRFDAEVRVEADGTTASGRSVVELISLRAGRGARVRIVAEGPEAERAAAELAELVARGFPETEEPS